MSEDLDSVGISPSEKPSREAEQIREPSGGRFGRDLVAIDDVDWFDEANVAVKNVRPERPDLHWTEAYESTRPALVDVYKKLWGDEFEAESPVDDIYYSCFLEGWNLALRAAAELLKVNEGVFETAVAVLGEGVDPCDLAGHLADWTNYDAAERAAVVGLFRAHRGEATAHEAEGSPGRTWRPIATAPLDGTDTLLWAPQLEPWVSCFNEGVWWWYGAAANPTHWMPLPEPPEEGSQGQHGKASGPQAGSRPNKDHPR